MPILYFFIVLGVLILIHEWGHFIMARRAGIRVDAFAIGFGPKLFGFQRGETEFKVCLFPLGGYVKMLGEDPEETAANDPAAFTAKPVSFRAAVVLAGPMMNFCLACLLMPVVFFLGRSEPVFLGQAPLIEQVRRDSPAARGGLQPGDRLIIVDGAQVESWEEAMDALLLFSGAAVEVTVERSGRTQTHTLPIEPGAPRVGLLGVEPPLFVGNEPIINHVLPGGEAARAGLLPGDRILAVGATPIEDWSAMADTIHASKGAPLDMRVERQGREVRVTVQPHFEADLKRYVIGVQKDPAAATVPMTVRRYNAMGAIVRGEQEVYRLAILTVRFLTRIITHPSAHYRSLGGPIQIAQASASAAKRGLSQLLWFAAFLSLQLAMLNCLPIPVLDGGHLLFLAIEGLIRRPVSARVRVAATQGGLVFLVGLLLIVTWNDLDNLLGLRRWVEGLF